MNIKDMGRLLKGRTKKKAKEMFLTAFANDLKKIIDSEDLKERQDKGKEMIDWFDNLMESLAK